jgi:plastocyanin
MIRVKIGARTAQRQSTRSPRVYTGRVRRLLFAFALLTGLSFPASAQAAAGRIDGTVTLSREIAAKRLRFRVYSEPGKGATPKSLPSSELKDEFANVVLYLERDGAGALSALPSHHPDRPAIAQRDERFLPHVLPVLLGTTVDFPNEDEVFHNVFSLSGPRRFDLPKYPTGESRSVTFPRAGVVNVFCHIHSDMSAVVLVLDNPYFVTPDSAGTFSLAGVPPGEYTLVAWHERIKPVRQKVRIVAGQSTPASFNIPLPQPPDR